MSRLGLEFAIVGYRPDGPFTGLLPHQAPPFLGQRLNARNLDKLLSEPARKLDPRAVS